MQVNSSYCVGVCVPLHKTQCVLFILTIFYDFTSWGTVGHLITATCWLNNTFCLLMWWYWICIENKIKLWYIPQAVVVWFRFLCVKGCIVAAILTFMFSHTDVRNNTLLKIIKVQSVLMPKFTAVIWHSEPSTVFISRFYAMRLIVWMLVANLLLITSVGFAELMRPWNFNNMCVCLFNFIWFTARSHDPVKGDWLLQSAQLGISTRAEREVRFVCLQIFYWFQKFSNIPKAWSFLVQINW